MDSYLLIPSLSRCKFVLGSEHDNVSLTKHGAKVLIFHQIEVKETKILNFCAFLGRNDTGMRIFH